MEENATQAPRATKRSAESKAKVTDSESRSIIAAESAARDKKTERLRALRLGQEAAEAPAPAKKKAAARKKR